MDPSQGEIIRIPKMQELSSLFMTHRLSVMHALVKFHEYIPYGLGVMVQTPFTICNYMTHHLIVIYAPVKFPEYIPYGLGVMARTLSGTYGRTDGWTDGTDRGNT